jgi:hypothetical protein
LYEHVNGKLNAILDRASADGSDRRSLQKRTAGVDRTWRTLAVILVACFAAYVLTGTISASLGYCWKCW